MVNQQVAPYTNYLIRRTPNERIPEDELLIIFSLTIFASAFLLFLIQPMFARMVLPMLGGVPAVWNTAIVFYQAALLCGYAYAHVSSAWLGVRRQSLLHLCLMALALLALPIGVPVGWKPPVDTNPLFWLLGLLIRSAGLPFFIISATSPLLQKWFSSTGHKYSSDPYFLYAASNVGSMLALLSYPVVAEPLLTLQQQSWWWTVGYVATALMMGGCAMMLWIYRRESGEKVPDSLPDLVLQTELFAVKKTVSRQLLDLEVSGHGTLGWRNPSAIRRRLRWVALAAVPSSFMLSVTTYLTTDIAAVPLLWIIPLAIYLLSFILVFARRPPLSHKWMLKAMPIVVLPLVIVLILHGTDPIGPVMSLHILALFLVAMVCHGELASDRPGAERLTEYYLFLSLGGVLGGSFNTLVAPLVFNSIAEYPIMVTAACLLLPHRSGSRNLRTLAKDMVLALTIGLASIALGLILQRFGVQAGPPAKAVVFGIPIIAAFSFSHRPIRFGLSVGAIFLAGAYFAGRQSNELFAARSFFGLSTIKQEGPYRKYAHGTTLHGMQCINPSRIREPLLYYFRTGPLGQIFTAFEAAGTLRNVAVVGLGIGGVTCYANAGQKWTYFEIDPVVEKIARDARLFTYIRDCPACLKIILGDGRLSLAEIPDSSFDILILDAYSSDSVPVHLLTREAIQLYLKKLAPRGILVFHISNRYLDMEPVLGNLAREMGLYCLVQFDQNISAGESSQGKAPSKYLVMSRTEADIRSLSSDKRWVPAMTRDDVGVWTDNYSSILRIIRWHR